MTRGASSDNPYLRAAGIPMPSVRPIDRTDGALDRAIVAHRENPSAETHAALMAAGRTHVDAFYAEQAREFVARTS